MKKQVQPNLFGDKLRAGAYNDSFFKARLLASHQGEPSFTQRLPTPYTEIEVPGQSILPAYARERAFRFGECSVILTHDGGTYGWHLSIAHPSRYPMWDEIAEARYVFCPQVRTMAIVLPELSEYVNLHPRCFQLIEIATPDTTAVLGTREAGTEPSTENSNP